MSHEQIQSLLMERGLLSSERAALELARSETSASEDELSEFFGHGPISDLLADESVTEILVNGFSEIWCERGGVLELLPVRFSSDEALRRYSRRILAPHNRKVDQRAPFADVVMEGGVRVHVAAPPISRKGICLSIRKPSTKPWTLQRLEQLGGVSPLASAMLKKFLADHKNIFVCGGTGTGKTSLLSALLSELPATERILALEDVSEIRSSHPHFISLESRPANQEGEGELPICKLLREALRMRPDRIVVGECRGPEAMDLLMALNTGHKGSMGTIHANSPRDALHRLETLALLAAGNLRESAVKMLVGASINVVVHLERFKGGRRLASLAEVRGLEGGNFLLKETVFS